MDVCIILDQSDKNVSELEKLVKGVESSMEFEVFQNVQEFADWFKNLSEEPPEDEYFLRLIITSHDLLGAKYVSLFEKINQFMLDKGYLKDDLQRVPLLVTAYDDENFDPLPYQLDIFDNIMLKPFDGLVDTGRIAVALKGEKGLSGEEVRKFKPIQPIEMLKRVEIDRITELGFRSISTKKIETHSISRYYLPTFEELDTHTGVYAICTKVTPLESGQFMCNFSYFGLEAEQSRQIRSIVAKNKTDVLTLESDPTDTVGVVLIIPEAERRDKVIHAIRNTFKNADITAFKTYSDFMTDTDPDQSLQDWLNDYPEENAIVLEYTKDKTYLRATRPESGEHIDKFMSLTLERLATLKTLAERCTKDREGLQRLFSGQKTNPIPLILDYQGSNHFYTLEHHTPQPKEGEELTDEEMERIYIKVRASTTEEVAANMESSRLPENLKFLFVSEIFAERHTQRLVDFCKQDSSNPIHLFGLGKTPLTLFEQAKRLEGFDDYLIDPVDDLYLKKKMLYLEKTLKPNEELSRSCIGEKEVIKVGNQVEMTNFSEVGLSFEYDRELSENSFREFVIFINADRRFVEISGKQIFAEAGNDDSYLNHFVVFGHGDKISQKIRQWLNEQYALSKQEENSTQ